MQENRNVLGILLGLGTGRWGFEGKYQWGGNYIKTLGNLGKFQEWFIVSVSINLDY